MEMLPMLPRLEGSRNNPVPTMFVTTSDDAPTNPIFLSAEPCISAAASGLDALDVALAVLDLDTMRVVAESGEGVVPGLQRLEIADPRAIGRARGFAGHHHRDAGRVG